MNRRSPWRDFKMDAALGDPGYGNCSSTEMTSTLLRIVRSQFDDIPYVISWKAMRNAPIFDRVLWLALILNPAFWILFFTCKWAFSLLLYVLDLTRPEPKIGDMPVFIPQTWLVRRTTIEQAERENSYFPERSEIDGIAFGFSHRYWTRLVQFMEPNDQIWYYRSPSDDRVEYGYVIVRDNNPVAFIQTSPDFDTHEPHLA